jgi:hypothetical protein
MVESSWLRCSNAGLHAHQKVGHAPRTSGACRPMRCRGQPCEGRPLLDVWTVGFIVGSAAVGIVEWYVGGVRQGGRAGWFGPFGPWPAICISNRAFLDAYRAIGSKVLGLFDHSSLRPCPDARQPSQAWHTKDGRHVCCHASSLQRLSFQIEPSSQSGLFWDVVKQ